MTKRGIIEELVSRRRKFSERESATVVNAMFDAMAQMLAEGNRVEVRGFGSFSVKQRRSREGRNPKTGEPVAVDAKRVLSFRAGKELRLDLNEAADSRRWA